MGEARRTSVPFVPITRSEEDLMVEYKIERLRNVALLGHGSTGKTSLAEAMLFDTGAISRLGRVEEGTTASDYDDEEIRRTISLSVSILPCEWDDHKLNVLDTPGYTDFVGEVKGAIRVVDGAIILVDAVAGVEVGTELVWSFAEGSNLPRLIFVNKMDRENANFGNVLESLSEKFGANFVPFQMPIGSQGQFQGVVDLVTMKAYLGEQGEEGEVPADLQAEAESARLQVVEAAAESEDELIMKYLEGEELTPAEIKRGLRLGVGNGAIVPVLCGSATDNVGVQPLLRAIIEYLPSPAETEIVATNLATQTEETLEANELAPLTAVVFKTIADPYVGKLTYFRVYSGAMESDSRVLNARGGEEERIGQLYFLRGKEQQPTRKVGTGDIGAVPKLAAISTGDTLSDKGNPFILPGIEFPSPVFSAAVHPKTKADLDKLSNSLARLVEEDPTFQVRRDSSTRETILTGMGPEHVDIATRRLQQKFGVEIVTTVPRVPYRETITKTATADYLHKKQTGGAGQYAKVFLRVEPLERGAGFEYDSEVFGGRISHPFIASIQKGIKQILEQGVIAGYPVADVKAIVYDGKEHPVDSKDIAFQIAGREGFKLAFKNASPVLLEPIMDVAVTVPEQFMGDILGDLNTKRARVQGMEQERGRGKISVQVPLAEMQRYAIDLSSRTQGRGLFTMEFSHYEEVPAHTAQGIIEEAKRETE